MSEKLRVACLLICFLLLSGVCCKKKRFAMNKPHMLFQVGSREPVSINSGWGYWSEYDDRFNKMRLLYENEQEGLFCQFTQHNGQSHFREVVKDSLREIDSEIKYQSPAGRNDWEALISMNPRKKSGTNESTENRYWPFAYFSIENNDYNNVDLVGYASPKKLAIERGRYSVKVTVMQNDLPKEVFTVKALSAQHKLEVFGLEVNVSESWNAKSILREFQHVKEAQLNPESRRDESDKSKKWTDYQLHKLDEDQWETGQFVFVVISTKFNSNQTETFHITMAENGKSTYEPFDHAAYDQTSQQLATLYDGQPKQDLLKHVLFNLLGGIAHYYGPLYAQNSLLKQEQTWTFSTTPSRLIFPRCFLWDDGFHLTILADKHPNKTIEFLGQWIAKIDLFGWIAREQIRGYQVSAMMPDMTFVYQDSLEGNPPTLMLPIRYMIEKYPESQQLRTLLQQNMWKLEKWFRYFKTTQSHFDLTDVEEIDQNIKFRWRCKDSCQNGNFMGSGLDDYPRQDTNQLSKQHVDLISWLYFFSESLEKISQYLGQEKGEKYYRGLKNFYNETLYAHYLDPQDNLFKDISVSKSHNINEFVTHIGYINLFPFMMGMLTENSEPFNKVVEVMRDPNLLWSSDGIRSLSKSDKLYGTGDNYWRGAVWMPINYMILRACKLYYPSSTKVLHDKLRENLIDTVDRNHQNSGYLYENYHERSGNRGHPFYGWTSLINPIILDLY